MAAGYRIQFEWYDLGGAVRLNSSSRVLLSAEGSRAVCEASSSRPSLSALDVLTAVSVVLCLARICTRKAVLFRQSRPIVQPEVAPCTPEPKCARPPVIHPRRCHSAVADLAPCYSEPREERCSEGERVNGEEETEDERENPAEYCLGGYHPVSLGDLYSSRYYVIKKLGWGHFSTVWFSWDLRGKRFVALKIVKSAPQYTESALDEIKLLNAVQVTDKHDPKRQRIVELLDHFKINGPNGDHICMVFEVMGDNLLKLIIDSKYRGVPLPDVKILIKQVLEGLCYLHEKCKIIHTDIKPENVLMCVSEEKLIKMASEATKLQGLKSRLPLYLGHEKLFNSEVDNIQNIHDREDLLFNIYMENNSYRLTRSKSRLDMKPAVQNSLTKEESLQLLKQFESPLKNADSKLQVKIADLGNSCWVDQHFSDSIQTRQYRSLEVIIGAEYGVPADIWSLACMAFELATGDYLFEPQAGEDYTRDEDHLAHIIELLGPVPRYIINSGKWSEFFFRPSGELRNIHNLKPWCLYEVLTEKYHWTRQDALAFSAFLSPMLAFDPELRATAAVCLNHDWLKL
ncbi:unnamed protein product [Nezara viridula]|uniref:non-specific serine/threonine protein kinase n=1 Tax=Nezara viridula TaxID=85310 RepID=A0A9P0EAL8_NEZVI|nr:unnamed protein product [Nezara viridula]